MDGRAWSTWESVGSCVEGVDELDVEGLDGAEGPGVGLPVEVA